MSDYTPTTPVIRGAYIQLHSDASWESKQPRLAEFNRWLDEVKSEAWDEGYESAALRIPEGVWHDVAAPHPGNPYRQEQENE